MLKYKKFEENFMSRGKKTEFLQFRISREDKELVEKGANLKGLDISEYVRMKALEAAKEEIENKSLQTKIIFSSEEWENFLQIMETSSEEINPNLKRAFERLNELEAIHPENQQENFG